MNMCFAIVCFVLSLCLNSFADICVLEKMVTLQHPQCEESINCPETSGTNRIERSTEDEENIVLLKPGSPALSHYASIKANDEPSIYANFLNYKYLYIGKNSGHYCNELTMYRSYDGKCNNLENPTWGCTNSEMIRLLPPKYAENGQITKSKSGADLPLARVLSTKIFIDRNKPSKKETLAAMQWGQLIAHDIGRSPSYFDKPVDCCISTSKGCCAIKIPPNDKFYSQFNVSCLNMVRTRYTNKTINCTRVPYQIAAVSHPIDLSQLYGSTIDTVHSVRQYEGGLLAVHVTENGRVFPELSNNPELDCNSVNPNTTCFHSGDDRINQNTQLTCLLTVLLREHNRIAKSLAGLNPKWNDELLFQESRAILIALYQHISYNEWLPLILEEDYLKRNNLIPLKEGYTQYRNNVNLATINSFMAGAFRVFHSQIQGNISMYNAARCPFRTIHLSDWMARPSIVMQDMNLDSFLIGLTMEPDQYVDRYFTTQITEMMFHGNFPYGEDLESFDIERGRDHGLPSYNDMRELCNFPRAVKFSDLIGDIDEESVKLISELYESVEDVDFFVGGTLEIKKETFNCIIGEQFVRKKFGDRFWYEHNDQRHSFTPEQLQEIRKATFSRLLCDNGDNITTIQPNGLLSYYLPGNAVIKCSALQEVNLTKWKQ